jgi:beta-glucosidase
MTRTIPAGFTLGAATSSFQIEGAADQRGETIWDRFIAERGLPDHGLTACDHVARVDQDLDLMAELGLEAYRFSVAWARVLPDGRGRPDPRGLGFYDRLVDGLLERGIAPWLTLYHWDLPQTLEDRGGWRTRDTVGAFAEYTELMVGMLGDRVPNWLTHNEPWVASMLGHRDGLFAPGARDMGEALTVAHHLLVSHGEAAQVLASVAPQARVGIAIDCRPAVPASDRETDVEATRHFDGFRNRWFLDPLFGRGYPEDMATDYRARGLFDAREDGEGPVRDGDLELIAQPLDVLGLNYYTGITVDAGQREDETPSVAAGPNPPAGHTEMGWAVQPDVLHDFLLRLTRDYAPRSIMITENGASYSDGPDVSGRVRDVRRIAYLHAHLSATLDARDAGAPVEGHLTWSLLDNLEWTMGFSQRFGLIWVDHATQRRVIKDSGLWLRDAIDTRRLPDPPETGETRHSPGH